MLSPTRTTAAAFALLTGALLPGALGCSITHDLDELRERLPTEEPDAGPQPISLEILTYSDLTPGVDFDRATLIVQGGGVDTTSDFSTTGTWTAEEPRSLNTFEFDAGDELTLTVRLLDVAGTRDAGVPDGGTATAGVVLERTVTYTVTAGETQLVIPLWAACGLVCPGSNCVASASGITRCVLPGCILGDEAVCDECNSKLPPSAPTREAGDVEEDDVQTLTFGLRDPKVDPDIWAARSDEITYDIDGYCTSGATSSPCTTSIYATDGQFGEDNVFASTVIGFVNMVANYGPDEDFQTLAEIFMEEGVNTPMIHVTGWNGEDNDAAVVVWLSVVAEFDDRRGGNTSLPNVPSWDGQDVFYPRADDFNGGDVEDPKFGNTSTTAWIRDGVLVANFEGTDLRFQAERNNPPFNILLSDGVLTGTITNDGSQLSDVIIAGRAGLDEVLESLVDSVCVAEGSATFSTISGSVANFADVRASRDEDGMGLACDGMSAGLGFTGYAVQLGDETREAIEATCD